MLRSIAIIKQVNALVLLFICFVGFGYCDLASEFRQHVKRVSERNYPCNIPQPRTVHVKELVSEEEWTNIQQNTVRRPDMMWKEMLKILPLLTVLHRCASSGCCNETNRRCHRRTTEELTLTFGKINRGRRAKIEYFTVSAHNDTSCECQLVESNDIK